MQITGAFLAVQAEIVDQKLNVTSGVLDWISVPRSGQVDGEGNVLVGVVYLVTLMQAGPDDSGKPYRMTTELVDGEGSSHVVADEIISVETHSGENRFWVSPLFLSADGEGGRMVLIQAIEGGGSISIPVDVHIED
jgi:hypothetical protein